MKRAAIGLIGLAFLACCSGGGTGTKAATASSSSGQSTADVSAFCFAYTAVSLGIVPQSNNAGVQTAHDRVNALKAAAPAEIQTAVTQMTGEYNAGIDAFASLGFDAQ